MCITDYVINLPVLVHEDFLGQCEGAEFVAQRIFILWEVAKNETYEKLVSVCPGYTAPAPQCTNQMSLDNSKIQKKAVF